MLDVDLTYLKKILNEGTVLSTSGSTGSPKRINQPVKKLLAANSVAREVQQIDSNSRILTVCTLNHAGGLLAQTLPGFEVGAYINVQPFNAFAWTRQIQDYTHSHLTPNMARAIIKTKSFSDIDLTSITIMCGSDRVQSNIIRSFIQQGATFIVNWGMTEVGPVAINKTFRPDDEVIATETIMGDTAFCETKIVNGELYVRGDICVYDDWFATGDSVLKIQEMFYYIGRI
jgi:acyl-CoA synthetase (AMP-forming)/AMP-acid ligase II